MRAKQFTIEANIGTNPKRPARTGSRPERGHEPQKRYVTDRKTGKQYDPDEEFSKMMNSPEFQSQMKRMAQREGTVHQFPKKHKGDLENTHDCPKCGGDLQGGKYMGHQVKVCMPCKQVYLPPNSGIDRKGNKVVDEIAGAFPSSSTREKWAKDAAASNAAEAKRQADIKAKADAERLRVNNAIVDKEQRINYHPMPDNEVPAKEGIFDTKPKVDWNARAKQLLASGLNEQQVYQQLVKEGCPPKQAQVYVQAAQMEAIGESLAEHGKASRALCTSGRPDNDLGASNLASCKSQGLRARDGEKSHLIGHGNSKVRVTVGGKKIKGKKYGGPLPDYGTRKGQL